MNLGIRPVPVCLAAFALFASAAAASILPADAGSAAEPVRYVGERQPDKRYHDGRLPHAVGVHRYQAFRANRSQPSDGSLIGATYNHAPMLAYWRGRFWLQWLDNTKEEHNPPGRTQLASSIDGRTWTTPRIAFPEIALPEIKPPVSIFGEREPLPAGTPAVYHQRMGFYTAPNGRLLTIAFLSYCLSPRDPPNLGAGIGRMAREVYADGTLGPIFFVRYNREVGWNEANTAFAAPCYTASKDEGFREACEALLGDKLVTQQWWEEDRARDGFFALDPDPGIFLRGFNYFERPDGVLVGLWKETYAALSTDGGKSWSTPVICPTTPSIGAKVWGQRTPDGRYALVYDHSASRRNRFPLVVVTSDDGSTFDDLLCVHGEVPPIRYQGVHKNEGPQYMRGIFPGNGTPPGDRLWLTYSVGKEDIWVTSVETPVTGIASGAIHEDFEKIETNDDLKRWNLYVPQWAPVRAIAEPNRPDNRCLQISDEEPHDYALAEVAFPEARTVTVEFKVKQVSLGHGRLYVEVQDRVGRRPVQLRFDGDTIGFDIGSVESRPVATAMGVWQTVRLDLDCAKGTYDVHLNGRPAHLGIKMDGQIPQLQRLVFRTGPWRGEVPLSQLDGYPANPGLDFEDRPGADFPTARSEFLIDDVRIE